MSRSPLVLLVVTVGWTMIPATFYPIFAQEKAAAAKDGSTKTEPSRDSDNDKKNSRVAERQEKLAEYLSGARFVGKFTIEGREDAEPKTEQYVISKCEKLPEKDLYRLTARIKYGDVDNEVPLDLKILWSGTTPVITLDSFWIPGMGTFGARVLIHRGRYAGTWQHDEKGGHLFGVIEKDEQ